MGARKTLTSRRKNKRDLLACIIQEGLDKLWERYLLRFGDRKGIKTDNYRSDRIGWRDIYAKTNLALPKEIFRICNGSCLYTVDE
jgi:hypothetical protein